MSTHYPSQIFTHRLFVRVLMVLAVIIFTIGLVIVPIERSSGNIKTGSDGLWWAATTASGVGYGDRYPVTPLGRVVGVVLQFAGVLSFGMIIGLIGGAVNKRQEDIYWAREFERFNLLEKKIESLDKKLQYLVFEQAGQPIVGSPEESQGNRD